MNASWITISDDKFVELMYHELFTKQRAKKMMSTGVNVSHVRYWKTSNFCAQKLQNSRSCMY